MNTSSSEAMTNTDLSYLYGVLSGLSDQVGKSYSIVCDQFGTPTEAYDDEGKEVWYRRLDMNSKILEETQPGLPPEGYVSIPFLFQGQYYDVETKLAYNRFRYYAPEWGMYISQDPIRLEAGLTNLYAYVHDTNGWIDPLVLIIVFRGDKASVKPENVFNNGIKPKGTHTDLLKHTSSNTTAGRFVSSSAKIEIAKGFAGKNGYVYVIDTERGLDVSDILGDKCKYPELLKFSILDGVPSQDIVGAYRMHKGQMIDEFIPNPQYKEYKGVDPVSDLH